MEISFQAVAFWVLYQVLGLQGFQHDDVYHDRSLDEPQIKLFRSPGWNMLSHYPKEVANNINREKRFFEFNPVAFGQKPKDKLVDEERRKQFLLSPFISSLERLQTFSEQDNAPRFKSAFITKDKKPKNLKPFLDHFSGVKSSALHFKHPGRLSNFDTSANDESLTDKLRPVSGISMRAFFDPNTYKLSQKYTPRFNDEQSIHAVHSTWSDLPKYDRKNKLQSLIDKSLDLNVFGVERPGYDQYSSNNKGDLIFNDLYHKNINMGPELFDLKQNDGSFTSQNIQSTITERGNSKAGQEKVPNNFQIENNLFDAIPGLVETITEDNDLTSKEKNAIISTEGSTVSPLEHVAYTSGSSKDKFDHLISNPGQNFKTDSKPHFGFDLESYGGFQAFDYELNTNGEGSWEAGNTALGDSLLQNDFGFGSFGDIIENKDNKQDQSASGGFGSFKESGSIPSFDNDDMEQDEFQIFEQGFGSFSTDNVSTRLCILKRTFFVNVISIL